MARRGRREAGTRRLLLAAGAATRLEAASRWLAARPPQAEVLVVAPTWEACDELVRAELGGAGARFGIVRMTLERLAARLATPALVRAGRVPATALSQAAVAAHAVHRLQGEGVFHYFRPVADRPGFPPAVARTLEELRMHGVTPDDLRALPRGGVDLALLAVAVGDELAGAALVDRAAVFDAAIAAVDAGTPLAGLPLLLLDLPVATALEERLVAALASRAPDVLATVPAGDAVARMFLERALDCRAEDVTAPGDGSLASLQRHLFGDPPANPAPLDASVRLSAWPGEARECVEIARAVQAEAARGVPFDRMAVLLHAPGEYVAHLEEAFGRAEIPSFFARGTRRPHTGGRALLTLLACRAEGLSARRFAEYLSLSQLPDAAAPRPEWAAPVNDLLPQPPVDDVPPPVDPVVPDPDTAPVVAGTLRAPRYWEQLLVDASVIGGGSERWKARLDGLEQELRRKREAIGDEDDARVAYVDRQLQDLEHLRRFALPLIELLANLPAEATWGVWLERLDALALAALRDPVAVRATLGELAPMAPVGPIDLDELRLVLAPRLRDVTAPPPRRRYGAVFVAPTSAVRGLAFDVVFVPGLAENLFPGKIVEDPVLLDVQRRALAAALPVDAERVAGERLALRLAAGAATQRVFLSYPRVDVERARPRVPSFYALEALQATEGRLPGFDELTARAVKETPARLGWPAPERATEAIDEAEYDLALLAPLLDADEATTLGTAHYLLGANPHLARALRARGRRWIRRWTPSDGLVDPEPLAREAMAKHQLATRTFSPTALQHFAACPYRFFLQAVHRLAPREEPVAIEVMDPLTRGGLFHDVQFGVLMQLRRERRLPLTPDGLAAANAILDGVLHREAEAVREKLKPAIPRVWQDGIDVLRADLREWLRRQTEDEEGWVPQRFELAFGLPKGDREYADPDSHDDPVQVTPTLRMRGSIDLVERHPRGGLRATDHKTGKVWAKDGVVVGGGKVLQPVLYALACEQMLREPVESGRLYYCTSTGGYTERVVPLDSRARASIDEVVRTVGEALEQGFLPAAPEPGACTYCDYRPVCGPYEEVRTARKPAERLAALQRLRALP